MLSQILFPCDLSATTELAFDRMLELAVPFRARVTLFHAFELLSVAAVGINDLSHSQSLSEIEAALYEKALAHLSYLSQKLDQAGLAHESLVVRGSAGALIVETAVKLASDLIVMGSRGHQPAASLLMGSTSTYVINHCQLPMLIIPSRPN